MTKEELLAKLKECEEGGDVEGGHYDADAALIEYINDPDVREAYERIEKWYA